MSEETELPQAQPDYGAEGEAEGTATHPEIPIGIVLARILVVTAMSFSAAVAIFCLVGALWEIAALAAVMTVVFLFLMFGVERLAEH
jgi:hypothetical protein